MALSSLAKRTFRVLWGWLLPLTTVSILVTSCASAPGTAAPTPTVPAVYATAAAQTTVWQALQKLPLHLPTITPGTPCPTSHGHWLPTGEGIAVGSGPLYAVLGQGPSGGADERQRQGILQYLDAHAYGTGTSGWGGMKVLWVIDVHARGPMLIRGHQVDGLHSHRRCRRCACWDRLRRRTGPPRPVCKPLGAMPIRWMDSASRRSLSSRPCWSSIREEVLALG